MRCVVWAGCHASEDTEVSARFPSDAGPRHDHPGNPRSSFVPVTTPYIPGVRIVGAGPVADTSYAARFVQRLQAFFLASLPNT